MDNGSNNGNPEQLGRQIQSAVASLSEGIRVARLFAVEFQRAAVPVVRGFAVSLFKAAPLLLGIVQTAEYWKSTGRADVTLLFTKTGYLVPNDLSLADLIKLSTTLREQGEEAATENLRELIDGVFEGDRTINSLKETWRTSGFLAARWPLLREGLDAYQTELFGACTALLVTQAEGLVVELAGHSGRVNGAVYKELASRTLGRDRLFGPVVMDFIVNRMLSTFAHGSPAPDFSRHAIAHGGDVSYGTRENARRAILLIDTIRVFADHREIVADE